LDQNRPTFSAALVGTGLRPVQAEPRCAAIFVNTSPHSLPPAPRHSKAPLLSTNRASEPLIESILTTPEGRCANSPALQLRVPQK